ncbi:MAG: hypothetical protein ACRD0A_11875 [Acidimicrobiales bacterium]
MRKDVEQTAIRLVLLVWVAIAVLVPVAGQADGRLAARVAAVLAACIVTVEGARWLQATHGPVHRPLAPLVKKVRPQESRVPARLQSWVGLMRAAEGDPHVGPLLRDRLAELARARRRDGHRIDLGVEPDAPLDFPRLDAVIADIEDGH